MAQKPRRTSELFHDTGTSSIPRQSRKTRIPPTRKSSRTTEFTTGNDGTFLPIRNLNVAQKTPRKASYAPTPQKTPLGSAKKFFPGNDKNWIITESNKINEYLKAHEFGIKDVNNFGKDFYERGGIKNMSIKQFITILNLLLKMIAGNRFSIDPSCYVENIVKILSEIKYPYTVNRSWLKTPTATHCFHNTILLFTWLKKLAPSSVGSGAIHEVEKAFVSENDTFPDTYNTLNLIRECREIFSAWNKGSDQVVREAEIKLANETIMKTCNLKGKDDLETKIKEMEQELYDNDCVLSKDDSNILEFNKLEEEYYRQVKEKEKYDKLYKTDLVEINKLKQHILSVETLITSTKKRTEDLAKEIKNQKMNKSENLKYIEERNILRQELSVKKDSITRLINEDSENQVLYSRLLHRKATLGTEINTHMYNLFTELKLHNILSEIEEFNMDDDLTVSKINNLKSLIQTISEGLFAETRKIEEETKKYEEYLKYIEEEHEVLKQESDSTNEHIQILNNKLHIIYDTILQKRNECDKLEREYLMELNDINLNREQIQNELVIKTEKLKKLTEQNLTNWNNFEKQIEEIFKYKEEKFEILSEKVQDYENIFIKLRNAYSEDDDNDEFENCLETQ